MSANSDRGEEAGYDDDDGGDLLPPPPRTVRSVTTTFHATSEEARHHTARVKKLEIEYARMLVAAELDNKRRKAAASGACRSVGGGGALPPTAPETLSRLAAERKKEQGRAERAAFKSVRAEEEELQARSKYIRDQVGANTKASVAGLSKVAKVQGDRQREQKKEDFETRKQMQEVEHEYRNSIHDAIVEWKSTLPKRTTASGSCSGGTSTYLTPGGKHVIKTREEELVAKEAAIESHIEESAMKLIAEAKLLRKMLLLKQAQEEAIVGKKETGEEEE